jgi:UDP-N-acetylmuramoyl-L-alanyl-D-glutamate--2,6-diaminopimelate ligase
MDRVKILTYGLHTDATITPRNITYSRKGVSFTINQKEQDVLIRSNLVGTYNIANILAAYTATVGGLGIKSSHAQVGIAALGSIPGRMEAVDLGQDFLAYVDFAHTPNALRQTLETARQMTNGKVVVIIGSAGLRDRQKRRMMAECAVELADLSVFTAEDPRSESLADILDEMASGANGKGGVEGKNYWRIHDRGMAIRYGLSLVGTGDIVLVCGKGHEQSMCFGTIEYDWDDRVALRAALAEHLGVPGPDIPFLPTQD